MRKTRSGGGRSCRPVTPGRSRCVRSGRQVGAGERHPRLRVRRSDPVVLDPAIISDGESFRVDGPDHEGLVTQRPGTTQLIPGLATGWVKSEGGRTWTFTLRRKACNSTTARRSTPRRCARTSTAGTTSRRSQPDSVGVLLLQRRLRRAQGPRCGLPGPKEALYSTAAPGRSTIATIRLKRIVGVLHRRDDAAGLSQSRARRQ